MSMETIFALATARGKAGVAVIRISGPNARMAAETLARRKLPERGMEFCRLREADGSVLDDALVLTFAAPASFTGEDVAELQIHGSVSGIAAALAELGQIKGLRPAEPGEFTRRALENGKMDLAQVEGLADLIDAETEAQRKQAQRLLGGALGDLAESWRRDLIRAASLIEAVIDFADEDVPEDVTPEVSMLLTKVSEDLRAQLSSVKISERIRDGFEVAIVGPPNAGKSTLLNALAGREAAITSEIAGTTRDVIEVRMDLGGLPVTLLDTAGMRATDDKVEGLGIELARSRAERADVRVVLSESDTTYGIDVSDDDIILRPKADILDDPQGAISGKTGYGIDDLIESLTGILEKRSAGAGIATRERHRFAMQIALEGLEAAKEVLENGPDLYDIAAEEMRSSIRTLESLVGRIGVENLLDEIFSSFCLGK